MKYIIFALLITNLFSANLKNAYTISSPEFNASTIDSSIKNDFIIYTFNKNRHKKSFNAKDLAELFKEHHLDLDTTSTRLVHVKHVSNVNLQAIKDAVKAYYLEIYPSMKIKYVDIKTSNFIEVLPKQYNLVFKSNAFRYATSTLQIQDLQSRKRYFLNYTIKATIRLFKARHNINRGRILTQIDVLYGPVEFKRLKAMPFDYKQKTDIRLKKRLLKGKIIYNKDIELLPAVLKGSLVLVSLVNGTVHLEFQATALRDAHIGDEIYVEKRNKKRLRVKVIGKNLVEIQ